MTIGWRGRIAAALGLAALALPAVALAQTGNPPSPPYGLVFGTASGASVGQPVIAIVSGGPVPATCGYDTVRSDPSEGLVYAVTINAESQTPGCGDAGRLARIYFVGTAGKPSAFGTPSFTLDATYLGGKRQNMTLDTPLTNRLYAPSLRATP